MKSYSIKAVPPNLLDEMNWDSGVWGKANVAEVDWFHPKSSDHHPRTRARMMHDNRSLFLKFKVDDRYVLARNTEYLQAVYQDSCVEFFVKPKADKGYFNFEINCGGTMLLHHVQDWSRVNGEGPLAKVTPVAPELAQQVRISRSMPKTVWPEITEPTNWWIGVLIPVALFEHYIGPLGTLSGQRWRANFYKCADKSSHPHWASWSPVGEVLNFHQPDKFGELVFE